MIKKMLVKEFSKNKIVNVVLLLFIVMSAFLISSGTMVVIQLVNSLDAIFEVAKPPHFLQMHSGEMNQETVDQFSRKVAYVDAQETVEMLNIEASNIWFQCKEGNHWNAVSLLDNMMDNGFVVQNKSFDYLVDLNNQIVHLTDGEIGVPVSYMDTYELSIGDKVTIRDGSFKQEFKIVCFVRDAQMASSMASSIRFLVSKSDHEALKKSTGSSEYIIEYRFKNESDANQFQKLYQAQNPAMPNNGPAITYPLIKLLNGISGGLLAVLLSIEDNILLPGLKLRKEAREIVYQKAKQLMKSMGIDHLANHDINKVSGGQLQRAAICRALINQPKIIFCDEPTGALNSSSAIAVMDIMNGINQSGTTILIVTHDAKVAARADRVIFLSDGKITAACVLGKYKQSSDITAREEKVKCFLSDKQF